MSKPADRQARNTLPIEASDANTAIAALATSPTKTGCILVSPEITGMNGEIRAISAKRLKNLSSTPKTSDGRKMVARRERRQHRLFRLPFGRAIPARAVRIGADGGHLDEPADTVGRGEPGDPLGTLGMHRLERGRSALRQRANQVDDDLGPDDGTVHRALVHHRGIKRHDLPNRTHRLEEQRRLRVAHRHPHDVALLGQSLDHIAADEAGTAEHRRHAPYRHGR